MQRCLYGFAVRSLLPGTNEVEARLLYPRGEDSGLYVLDDPGAVLEQLAGFVAAAQIHAQAGDLLPGAGAADSFNDLAFALAGRRQGELFRAEISAGRRAPQEPRPSVGAGMMASLLPDSQARKRALTEHDATLLVEAGAGSGKTALMAGRVALLLACGVAPRDIVAITFTEAASSELLERISRYVSELAAGQIARGAYVRARRRRYPQFSWRRSILQRDRSMSSPAPPSMASASSWSSPIR